MDESWSDLMQAYRQFLLRRSENQADDDVVSVISFEYMAHEEFRALPVAEALKENITFYDGGTNYGAAFAAIHSIAAADTTAGGLVVIFMTDGGDMYPSDATEVKLKEVCHLLRRRAGNVPDLKAHFHSVYFERPDAPDPVSERALRDTTEIIANGRFHLAQNAEELIGAFAQISNNTSALDGLITSIGGQISSMVGTFHLKAHAYDEVKLIDALYPFTGHRSARSRISVVCAECSWPRFNCKHYLAYTCMFMP